MKKYFLCISIAFCFSILSAQKSESSIDFGAYGNRSCQVFRDHPSELCSNYIAAFQYSHHAGEGIELTYNHFRNRIAFGITADLGYGGFAGGAVSGLIFFKKWEKSSKHHMTGDFHVQVGTKNARVVGSIDVTKHTLLGLCIKNSLVQNTEGSFGYRFQNELYHFDRIKYDMLEIGLAIMTVKGADIKLTKYIGRTKRVVAGFNVVLTPWAGAIITAYDSAAAANISKVEAMDMIDNPLGFHMYVERYSNFTYHKTKSPAVRFGWYYRLGLIQPPFTWVISLIVDEEVAIKPEFCIGFFVNFD